MCLSASIPSYKMSTAIPMRLNAGISRSSQEMFPLFIKPSGPCPIPHLLWKLAGGKPEAVTVTWLVKPWDLHGLKYLLKYLTSECRHLKYDTFEARPHKILTFSLALRSRRKATNPSWWICTEIAYAHVHLRENFGSPGMLLLSSPGQDHSASDCFCPTETCLNWTLPGGQTAFFFRWIQYFL